jgi:hypothetical protein
VQGAKIKFPSQFIIKLISYQIVAHVLACVKFIIPWSSLCFLFRLFAFKICECSWVFVNIFECLLQLYKCLWVSWALMNQVVNTLWSLLLGWWALWANFVCLEWSYVAVKLLVMLASHMSIVALPNLFYAPLPCSFQGLLWSTTTGSSLLASLIIVICKSRACVGSLLWLNTENESQCRSYIFFLFFAQMKNKTSKRKSQKGPPCILCA